MEHWDAFSSLKLNTKTRESSFQHHIFSSSPPPKQAKAIYITHYLYNIINIYTHAVCLGSKKRLKSNSNSTEYLLLLVWGLVENISRLAYAKLVPKLSWLLRAQSPSFIFIGLCVNGSYACSYELHGFTWGKEVREGKKLEIFLVLSVATLEGSHALVLLQGRKLACFCTGFD